MARKKKPGTVEELRASGYRVFTVKQEMRRNLIEKIKKNQPLFSGIEGFEDSVIPMMENAILARARTSSSWAREDRPSPG